MDQIAVLLATDLETLPLLPPAAETEEQEA
jgi:hypothetical protein